MNFFKSHFWYNKNQRNGILFLVLLILVFQLIYVFVDFSEKQDLINNSEIIAYQNQIDSLKLIEKENQKPSIYPFNPNYLTDFKGYRLGMSVAEIDRLLDFRTTGKFVNSSLEFQKVTEISDSLLAEISPYFKFPDWVNSQRKKNTNTPKRTDAKISSKIIKKDLNEATFDDLKSIHGVGDKLAKRIISYRTSLQGYTFDEQIYEVYYLDRTTAIQILSHFKVTQKPDIQKININEATFKEVLRLPYIDYELTKKIFNYRNEIHQYSTIDELKKIDSFPLEKYDRITLYLSAE